MRLIWRTYLIQKKILYTWRYCLSSLNFFNCRFKNYLYCFSFGFFYFYLWFHYFINCLVNFFHRFLNFLLDFPLNLSCFWNLKWANVVSEIQFKLFLSFKTLFNFNLGNSLWWDLLKRRIIFLLYFTLFYLIILFNSINRLNSFLNV